MTIDENRARTVYQRIERETGVMPPEGSAMQEAVIRAMLALATEAAQPEGWVPSEKDAREDLKTIARRANILLTENAEVLTVTVERHVRSIRDTALRLAAASPTPPAPRKELIAEIAQILEPWAWETTSYNATVARDDATAKAEQIVAILPPAPLRVDADLRAAAVDAVLRVRWGDDAQKIRDYGGFYLERAEEIADAVLALTARQDAATDAGVERPSDKDLEPHLPETVRSEKRCGIQRSAWLTGWFVPWSPRNDNENAEGPWSHWVALAENILAADAKARAALTTPKPDASQGEALATQENNHAG